MSYHYQQFVSAELIYGESLISNIFRPSQKIPKLKYLIKVFLNTLIDQLLIFNYLITSDFRIANFDKPRPLFCRLSRS
jgi:hypothetical protein